MSTKVKRPIAPPASVTMAVMATPKTVKVKASQSALGKKALLDNFDLEVSHRTTLMREQLESTLSSFLSLVDSEILRIPKDMRRMTLGELERSWAGNFAETARAMKRGELEKIYPQKNDKEVRAEAVEAAAAGKRKRGAQTPLGGSPDRSNKNARTLQASSTASQQQQQQPQRKTPNKRTKATSTKIDCTAAEDSSRSKPGSFNSGLPQNHVFNPHLPATPKCPRAPKRNESILSVNGSPLAINVRHIDDLSDGLDGDIEDRNEGENEDENEDDLPDPEAMEAAAERARMIQSLAASTSNTNNQRALSSISSKFKRGPRAPSILFRQSLAPGTRLPNLNDAIRDSPSKHSNIAGKGVEEGEDGDGVVLTEIPLSDGRVISFNPLQLSPGRIDDELESGGLEESEKQKVKKEVREEAVRALMEKMKRWKAL